MLDHCSHQCCIQFHRKRSFIKSVLQWKGASLFLLAGMIFHTKNAPHLLGILQYDRNTLLNEAHGDTATHPKTRRMIHHQFIGLLRGGGVPRGGGSLIFPKVPQSSLGILRVPQLPPLEHLPLGTLQIYEWNRLEIYDINLMWSRKRNFRVFLISTLETFTYTFVSLNAS